MAKISSNSLPVFSSDHIVNFPKGSSIYAYSTRSARSNKFFVQRTSHAKTKQSLKVSGVKI